VGIGLPDRAATLSHEAALAQARQARADLDSGRGIWQTTEVGQTIRDLTLVRHARRQAEQAADDGVRWRDRQPARKEAGMWAQLEAEAQQRWETHVGPTVARLDHQIALHQASLEGAANQFERRLAASRAVIDNWLEQQQRASSLAHRLATVRNHLDGLPAAAEIRRAALQRQQLKAFEPPQHQPSASPSPRIDL
jgi:hypothetical protein